MDKFYFLETKRRLQKRMNFFCATAILIAVCGMGNKAFATAYTTNTTGQVTLASNWTPSGVFPGVAGDTWTITKAMTVPAAGWTIAGSVNMTAGSLKQTSATSGLISIGGTYSQSAGTLTTNAGGMTTTGLSTFSGGTVNLGAGTQTMSGMTISGATVNGGVGSVNISGAATFSSGSFIQGSGTIGMSSVTISGGTFTGGTGNVNISGALVISAGTLFLTAGTTTVSGNLLLSGSGVLDASGTGTDILNLGGSLSLSGSSYITNTPGYTTFNFTGGTSASPVTITDNSTVTSNASPYVSYYINSGAYVKLASPFGGINTGCQSNGLFTVSSGGTLDCANYTIGDATYGTAFPFTLSAGGTLVSANTAGITAAVGTATGSIITTGSGNRSFGAANYVYNGTLAQNTGTGLPTSLIASLTINNSAGLTLTSNCSVTACTFTSGTLSLNGKTLKLNGTVSGMSAANSITGSATSNLNIAGTVGTVYFDQLSAPGTSNEIATFTVSSSGTATLGNALIVGTTLALTSGTLTDGGNVVTVLGNITGTGTETGIGGITIPSSITSSISGATIKNLTLANAANISLSGNPVITGTLYLTGILTTGSQSITVPGASTGLSRAASTSSNFVNGQLLKSLVGNSSITYEVGDADYAPVTLALTGGTPASYSGYLGMQSTAGNPSAMSSSNIVSTQTAGHYWTMTTSIATGPTSVAPTFIYNTITGGTQSAFAAEIYNGSWGSVLTTVNGGPAPYTSALPGSTLTASIGNYVVGTQLLTPPTLAAYATPTEDNVSANPITFTDNAAWRATITSVTAKLGSGTANTLTAGTDYAITAGQLTLMPTVGDHYLTQNGSYSIVVIATGYANATVTQVINAGVATTMSISTTPLGPAASGGALTIQPVIALKDQFGNLVSSANVVTASASSATGAWTLGGTATATTSGGLATFSGLTATAAIPTTATIQFSTPGLPTINSTFNIPPAGAYTWHTIAGATGADLAQFASWTANSDGSVGVSPTNFTNNNQTYIIDYGTNPTIGSSWTVSGTGSLIRVGATGGSPTINFTNPAGQSYAIVGTINVSANDTITWGSTVSPPVFGTLDAASTVNYIGSTSYTIPLTSFGNFLYASTGNAKFSAGTTTIAGTYNQTQGTVTVANAAGTYVLNVGGAFNISGSGALVMSSNKNSVVNVTVGGNVSVNSSVTAISFNTATGSGSGTSVFQANGPTVSLSGSVTGTYIIDWGALTIAGNMLGVKGNLTIGGNAVLFTSGSTNAIGLVFNGSGTAASPQTMMYTNSTAANNLYSSYVVNSGTYVQLLSNLIVGNQSDPYSSFTIKSGGTLDCATYVISGGASGGGGVLMTSGATLATADTSGLAASITAASTAGTTYVVGANYVFYGKTKSPWPTTFGAPASVTINGVSVTSNSAFSPTGTVSVTPTATLDMDIYALGGTFTPAVSGTLSTANTSSAPIPSGKTWGGTVNYDAPGTQTVQSGTYNNFTFGTGVYNAGSTLTVNNVLTGTVGGVLNLGTHTLSGSSLSSAGSGSIQTQAASAAIPSSFTWAQNIVFNNATGGQTIPSGIYNAGLTNSNTSSINTVASAATVSVVNNLTLSSGSTLNDNGVIVTLDGTLAGSGTHTSTGSGAISITTPASNISGSPVLGNLMVASVFTVTGTPSISNILALGNNVLYTSGTGVVTIKNGGSVTRGTGYVSGMLGKNISGLTAGAPSISFEVGDLDYAPVQLTLGSITTPTGNITIQSNAGHDPNLTTSLLDNVYNIYHYWTIAATGASGFSSIAPLFTYNTSDINVGGPAGTNSLYKVQVWNGTSWDGVMAGTTDPTAITTTTGALTSGYNGNFSIGKTAVAPPVLAATAGANVDAPFVITFTDDATWRANISSVLVGTTTLTSGYTVAAGTITFTPAASVPASLLQTSGTLSIAVVAAGYTGANVSQPIAAGAAAHLVMGMQPVDPATNGGILTTQPTVLLDDQYYNLSIGTTSVTASASDATWIIGGGTSASGVSGTVTFTGITAATSGLPDTGAAITFTSPGLTPVTSAGFNIPYGPFTWYSKTGVGLDMKVLTNWTSDPSGIGGGAYFSPANFTNNNQTYLITNTTNPTITGNWSVSGSGSTIQIGLASGATPVNFINPDGHNYLISGTINISANDTLTWSPTANSNVPTLGTLDAASTVMYAGSAAYTIPAVSYGNLVYTSSGNATMAGACTIQSLILNNSSGIFKFNNGSASPSFTIANGVTLMSGLLRLQGSSGTGNVTVSVGGSVSLTTTNAEIDFNTASAGTTIINIAGNLNVSAGFITTSSTSAANGTLVFNGTGVQTYSNTSSHAMGNVNFKVNAGSTLQLQNNITLTGSGTAARQSTLTVNGILDAQTYAITSSASSSVFTLNSGATLETSNTGGVDATVAATNITRTYATGANYVFYPVVGTTTPFNSTIAANPPANVYINSGTITANYAFSPSATLTIASGATLNMGTFVLGGAFIPANSGTLQTQNTSSLPVPTALNWGSTGIGSVQYNAAVGGQTVMAGTYYNLATGTTSGNNTVSGNIAVNNNLTLNPGTLADNGHTITVAGNITGTGKHTSATGGSITMAGGVSAQTISNVTLGNLILNNVLGFNLAASPTTINGNLTITNGVLNIGNNNLAFGPSASAVSGILSATNMIAASGSGQVLKYYNADGTFKFPVGDATTNYSPVTLTFYGGSSGYSASTSYAAVNVTATEDSHNLATTNYISRYWTVNLSAITTPNYSVSATYVAGDVVGTESGIGMGLYTGSLPWQLFAGAPVSHTLTASGVTTGGEFTGIPSANASVSVSPASSTVCLGTGVSLIASGTGVPALSYSWSPATGLSATTGATVTVTPTIIGTTVYTVILTDGNGFTASNTATITATNNQWIGAVSTSWNDASNWACGSIPTIAQDVLIPGSGTYTFSPTLDISNGYAQNLTINATAALTLSASNQLNVTGNIINNSIVSGAGVIYLNGSGTQSLSGNGTVSNMTLDNGAGATIATSTDSVGVTGSLLINSGTFTTNGSLMMVSDEFGSGRIGASSGAVSGNVVVQQYIPGLRRAYRFIAHPFSTSIPLSQIENYVDITGHGGSSSGFTGTASNAPSSYWYNPLVGNSDTGSDPGWTPFTNTDGADTNAFNNTEGIRLYFRGTPGQGLAGETYTVNPVTYRTYGPVNQGNVNITLVKGINPHEDYNLIGNPYPSPVDIGTILQTNIANIQGGFFYVWNPQITPNGGFHAVMIGNTDTHGATSYFLGANESFEVRTMTGGYALPFAESNKGNTVSEILMRSTNNKYLTLNVYDDNYNVWDMLSIDFNDAATDHEDARFDGGKPPSPQALNFYSISADSTKLCFDARPFSAGKVIPLGIKSSYAQEFIIKAESIAALPDGGQVYLHDKYLQTYTLMTQGAEYKFTIGKNAASQGDHRFELSMKPASVMAAQSSKSLDVQMLPNPASSEVTISFTAPSKEQTTVTVMNVAGETVLTQDLGIQQNGSTQIAVDKLPAGVYMVELTSGKNKLVHRLVKE